MVISDECDVLVLGAGLQGAGVALELASRGHRVTLLDQDERPLNRASLRNEGKIHLGLMYANEPSRDSAFLQLEGGLRFRRIVDRWVRPATRWLDSSTPFHYLVAAESGVGVDDLEEHYLAVEAQLRKRLSEDSGLDYLGQRPERIVRRLTASELGAHFEADRFAAGFATAERALDTDVLAGAIREAVAASPAITFVPSHAVCAIGEAASGFHVAGTRPGGGWCCRARQVVNATWERKFALDRQIGLEPPPDLLHRLKFRVVAKLFDGLRGAPSVSMVLGRYGDVVVRSNGSAFLSWYPAGLRGWSHEIEPPIEWNAACRGDVDPALGRDIARAICSEIEAWYPGIGRSEALLVDAGAIVAVGRSDVDDTSSSLHTRTKIGVTSRGGYHSVDPGKLTTAPLFALEVADRVEAFARPGVR